MKELVGCTIAAIYTNDKKNILLFIDENMMSYIYRAVSECGSDAWLESTSNRENIINQEKIDVGIKHFPDVLVGYRDEEYRNESNGYYGGECNFPVYMDNKKDQMNALCLWMPMHRYLSDGNRNLLCMMPRYKKGFAYLLNIMNLYGHEKINFDYN